MAESFPSTAWTTITKANLMADAEGVDAMNRFVGVYWKPIYCFLRAKGHSAVRAEDLTQEFFLQLMSHDWLNRADPQRGRFRNFILTVLVRFVADQSSRRLPRQKAFDSGLMPVSCLVRNEEISLEPTVGKTPEEIFEERWASALVQSVIDLLRLSFEQEQKSFCFEVFARSTLAGIGERPPSQQELGEQLGITRDQVRYAQHQAELRFLQLLRAEVRGQTGSDCDVELEIRDILRRSGHPQH
jgi:RNA polymerase sigma-70 factor (ECF subfamily)